MAELFFPLRPHQVLLLENENSIQVQLSDSYWYVKNTVVSVN